MSRKLTLALSFIDEDGKVMATKKSYATWTLNVGDAKYDNKNIRETLTETFADQLIIDLKKGLMKPLVDQMFDGVISCTEKS